MLRFFSTTITTIILPSTPEGYTTQSISKHVNHLSRIRLEYCDLRDANILHTRAAVCNVNSHASNDAIEIALECAALAAASLSLSHFVHEMSIGMSASLLLSLSLSHLLSISRSTSLKANICRTQVALALCALISSKTQTTCVHNSCHSLSQNTLA